jgi:hypothetical protein
MQRRRRSREIEFSSRDLEVAFGSARQDPALGKRNTPLRKEKGTATAGRDGTCAVFCSFHWVGPFASRLAWRVFLRIRLGW